MVMLSLAKESMLFSFQLYGFALALAGCWLPKGSWLARGTDCHDAHLLTGVG
jgi:hypothetical protein